MSLVSMTGFARASGAFEGAAWSWEVKSVNGKGLDIRLRLPAGCDGLEPRLREAAQRHFKRGNLQAGLTLSQGAAAQRLTVNETALEQAIALAEELRIRTGGEKPRVSELLGLRGILELVDDVADEDALKRRDEVLLEGFEAALRGLDGARRAEGARLKAIVEGHVARIEQLTAAARDNPARAPETIRARLGEQVARLMETGAGFDRDRLHQEAVLIATRADVQEEIDRLTGHVEAARKLIASPEPAGRQLDFLAQEFNREANTLCSKALDREMTQTGLELKATIDQLREQVANIE